MIKQSVAFSLTVLRTLTQDIETSEMLRFMPLKNNSVTMGLNFLLASISAIITSNTINTFPLLDYSLLTFHRHHQLFVKNQ